MIKGITTTILLATAISNTTITSSVNRTVNMDNTTYWIEERINENNFNYGVMGYRDTTTRNSVNNQAFNIRQRSLEEYYCNRGSLNIATSTFYLVCNLEAEEDITINEWYIGQVGQITNSYEFEYCTLNYLWEVDEEITDQALNNYLDGTEYTTKEEYNNIVNTLNAQYTGATSWNLTEQDYQQRLNNFSQVKYLVPAGTILTFYLRINFIYDPFEVPYDTSYSPFGAYCKQLQYTPIEFNRDVPAGGIGEVVDIPGIMFTILGMPFTFVAQAFNLTIFPGTAYAVNLSHIFLAIVGAGILIFVVKKFLK